MRWQRIEVTVERRQRFIFRKTSADDPRLCGECITQSRMVTPEEAALICGAGTREIYRWLDTAGIHFIETNRRALLICLNSILGAHHASNEVADVVERHF